MKIPYLPLAAAAGLALAGIGTATAKPGEHDHAGHAEHAGGPSATAQEASQGSGRKISAALDGTQEVPSNSLGGTGSFSARVNPGIGQICYELAVENLAKPAVAAHIHRGEAGVNGGVEVSLDKPDAETGRSAACKDITRDLAMELIQTPQGFYVNVHNPDKPGGIVRGQLAKGD